MQRLLTAHMRNLVWALAGVMIWLSAVPLYATPSSSDPFAAPLDVQRQEAALLPSFASDLATAEQWDRYTVQARIDPEKRMLVGLLRLEYTNRAPEALDRIYFLSLSKPAGVWRSSGCAQGHG
jgi:hypothetical protein